MASPTPTLDALLRAARKGKPPARMIAPARRELEQLRDLATGAVHPVQRSILELMRADTSRAWAPMDLADELELPLSNVAYHVRVLERKRGLIYLSKRTPKRGAVKHHYRLTAGRVDRRLKVAA